MTWPANRLSLYDTTLRDGAQTHGVDFSLEDKRLIAQQLDALGIDYIEGGYPGANPTDTRLFAEAKPLPHAKLTAFGMTKRPGRSIANDPGFQALLAAKTSAVCLVAKTWDFHVDVALGVSLDENLAGIKELDEKPSCASDREAWRPGTASHFFDDTPATPIYALACAKTAYDAGARWVVLCDTNGGTLPEEIEKIVADVVKQIPGDHLGIHVHNDTDNGVANSLAAVRAGARQIQGTLNGLGERCGQRQSHLDHPDADAEIGLCRAFRDIGHAGEAPLADPCLAHSRRGVEPGAQPARALCRRISAFAHKGGIDVSAVQKNPRTYRACAAGGRRQPAQAAPSRPGRPLEYPRRARAHRHRHAEGRSAHRAPAR